MASSWSVGVPDMFLCASTDSYETPIKGKSTDLYRDALHAEPLPCKRGAIRDICAETRGKHTIATQSRPQAFLERALTQNIRSTVRVQIPDQKKKESWAEVAQKMHKDHERFAKLIMDNINKGRSNASLKHGP